MKYCTYKKGHWLTTTVYAFLQALYWKSIQQYGSRSASIPPGIKGVENPVNSVFFFFRANLHAGQVICTKNMNLFKGTVSPDF
jgi:hypothetical protein